MEFEKLKDCDKSLFNDKGVKVTTMGNVIELQYLTKKNCRQTIQMLKGGKEYVHLGSGEINECQKHDTRDTQLGSIRRTFRTIRGLINSNVDKPDNCLWITLTYKENMTDTKRLYSDTKLFFQGMKRKYGKFEYINVLEPQGRGAWHCHLLLIFDKPTFIPNNDIAAIWKQGFTVTRALDKNCDNLGAYLTAYLGDMALDECIEKGIKVTEFDEIKTVPDTDENGKPISKRYVKGARLQMYPANFNMIRTSRGIKRPVEEWTTREMAEKKVLGATKTFSSAIKLTDIEHDFESIVLKEQYNTKRV